MKLRYIAPLLLSACIGMPPETPSDDVGVDGPVADTADTRFDGGDTGDVGPPAHCSDGEVSGDESDIDCGGSCHGCSPDRSCDEASDCELALCVDGTCTRFESCAAIAKSGHADGDGPYPVDADGDGESEPVMAYCDMTTDQGVGYTMVRLESNALGGDQAAYRAACEAIGMEIVVPRSRGHGLSLLQFNEGETPNLIGVYPEAGASDTAGLRNWTGRCKGQPCRFYVTDGPANNAQCNPETLEPSGDSAPDGGLISFGPPAPDDGCPMGQFNDEQANVRDQGYVICSTNDAGPPLYSSCLEILQNDATQNTDIYNTHGMYPIMRPGQNQTLEVYCDFTRDGGGYSYVKVEPAEPKTTAEARDTCADMGLQLLVPRSRRHRDNAIFLGVDDRIGPSGADDYLRLLGVYPATDGASCSQTPMVSTNDECDMVAEDGGPFFVHDSMEFVEPDGDSSRSMESLVHTWLADTDTGMATLDTISETSGAPSADRFICHVGDKLP